MTPYDETRQRYKPKHIQILFIAESPPPAAEKASSRHFYRADKVRSDDRLFVNTIRALYPETTDIAEKALETEKERWLQRFKRDGYYMIEALQTSLPHKITKPQRQVLISKDLPSLLERVHQLAASDTKIVLIKSNVFEVASGPLQKEGFTVLNTELVDYPGQFNQRAYREKLRRLLGISD